MISKSILDEFQKKDIKLDSKQVEFLNLVEVSIKRDKKIFSFLRSKKIVNIYLYGGVGIGKTVLLKSIASKLNQEYKFIHFTNFMNHIKKRLDKLNGQKDPLAEFRREAFQLFESLLYKIKTETIKFLINTNLVVQEKNDHTKKNNFINKKKKISRNEPCSCGSGKKYKHCHGKVV